MPKYLDGQEMRIGDVVRLNSGIKSVLISVDKKDLLLPALVDAHGWKSAKQLTLVRRKNEKTWRERAEEHLFTMGDVYFNSLVRSIITITDPPLQADKFSHFSKFCHLLRPADWELCRDEAVMFFRAPDDAHEYEVGSTFIAEQQFNPRIEGGFWDRYKAYLGPAELVQKVLLRLKAMDEEKTNAENEEEPSWRQEWGPRDGYTASDWKSALEEWGTPHRIKNVMPHVDGDSPLDEFRDEVYVFDGGPRMGAMWGRMERAGAPYEGAGTAKSDPHETQRCKCGLFACMCPRP